MRVHYPLSNGATWVDFEDIEMVSQHRWYITSHGRVRAHLKGAKPYKKLELSRYLLSAPSGVTVDMIDGDPLNNCRDNLRICTQAENCRNKRGRVSDSGYIGVNRDRRSSEEKYHAAVKVGRKKHYVGTFRNAEDAAKARDEAAKRLHGEFAVLNFKEKK